MEIKFVRDSKGMIIAVDKNNKKIGKVSTMGDNVKNENINKHKHLIMMKR